MIPTPKPTPLNVKSIVATNGIEPVPDPELYRSKHDANVVTFEQLEGKL